MDRFWALALLALAGWLGWRGLTPSKMPDAPIAVLGGQDITLARCSTAHCLTVVVAPWCPHCRESTPTIERVRDALNQRGIHVRVVVGLDSVEKCRSYAAEFGPGTGVDERKALHPNGVPHFYVSDASGAIVKDWGGALNTDDPDQWVRFMGI